MGYRELIDWNIGTVYQTGIATKILQHMDRIRNESDISQSRRWISCFRTAGMWPMRSRR